MGRRKIEIKAIKDDRNRSVTFLKRKGGLFKKAHELSVLCSVDVAVFIFGNNKKLYEYSSADMQHLITRYQYHGGPNEHKGPSDFNGGQNDDDDDEDGDGTPPRGSEGMDSSHMMPPHFQGQAPPPFPHIRHQTASVSPPIPNGVPFQGHPAHLQRSHTPQPAVPSRPGSRGDMRRMGPGMMSQPVGPHGPHPGITYMPTPPIYNPSASNQSSLMPPQPGPYPFQPPQQQPPAHPPPQPMAPARRHLDPQPPPPVEPRTESAERPRAPLINTDTAIKKMSQRKSHSIFTPIEENRSILSQHLASFASEPQPMKNEAGISAPANPNRSQSADTGATVRNGETASPHLQQRSSLRNTSVSSLPDTPTTSLKINTAVGGTRPKPPRLTVQIPDGGSEAGSATGDSNSPRNATDAASHAPHRGSVVLPPPSPSGSGPQSILSAGAIGPPNPFARPVPQQNVNGDTPVSALPSRFLNNELLPSPSSFYPEWNFRGSDNNTLPSPLNFATPVVGTGPSFLREDNHLLSTSSGNAGTGTGGGSGLAKRKSPDLDATGHDENHETASDPKRLKVER
ncbi:SRF-type transcription factor (DNA-binding and dimerization domain) domain-containing protein [Trichoderma breve]|uniref:MADS-box MEF2 type transcription factor MIG1 n=1 Tax=Trichoderma breve TaxID=2034170 RepID=A0A9W9BM97_9HYPO|nr:SRF-type transcription factor (DNA-binding and dimerization domain) domain-containing protein [Trichoderma breve]KAJ4862995.1 SRF-type transcription factor (DNA-binding and dimerization domain) domain-containing protein [Trichoderma breve]